jgi:hypothetical protein
MITEETFVAYIQDPTAFIREQTGDNSLRGAMARPAYAVCDTDAGEPLRLYRVALPRNNPRPGRQDYRRGGRCGRPPFPLGPIRPRRAAG